MKRFIASLLILVASIPYVIAQENVYEHKTFTAEDGTVLNYRLLRPLVEEEGEKYPLVLFMHGAGERGNDNEKQLIHGSGMFLNPVNREAYPAYVVFPQCPAEGYWAFTKRPDSFHNLKAEDNITPILGAVMEMIGEYIESAHVDRSRVYVIGLSMGGMATYDLATRHPEVFAAAVPICGVSDVDRLKLAKGVSFRIYHGDADTVVPVTCSRDAYRGLKEAGIKVEYFEFPGCDHGSWNPAFSQPDFMEWLFKQKKSKKYMK